MLNKNAYILRGLSGSGKSTLARIIAESADRFDAYRRVFSTDIYFIGPNGEYQFNSKKLGDYHSLNQKEFAIACSIGLNPVICDNTNMCRWEMEPYITSAAKNGYKTHIILVGNPLDKAHQKECAERNVHGVTIDIIEKMAKKFEL